MFAPGGVGWRELTVDRNRLGGSLALQWRPSDTVDVSLQYFIADATFEQNENALWTEQGDRLTGSNLQVSNGYLVGGDIDQQTFSAGSARYNERESKNHDARPASDLASGRSVALRRGCAASAWRTPTPPT